MESALMMPVGRLLVVLALGAASCTGTSARSESATWAASDGDMRITVTVDHVRPRVGQAVHFHVHIHLDDGHVNSMRIFWTSDGDGTGMIADFAQCPSDPKPTPGDFDKTYHTMYEAKDAGSSQQVTVHASGSACTSDKQLSAEAKGTVSVQT